MRRFKMVALLIACSMVLSGCSLVRIDEEKVMNRVVASVNGVDIYRYEVDDDYVNSLVQSQVDMYSQFGMDFTEEDYNEMFSDYQKTTLDSLVMTEVFLQKAAELEITLTDAEKEECRTNSDATFEEEKANLQYQVEMEVYDEVMAEASLEDADSTEEDTAVTEEDAEGDESFFSEDQQAQIDLETERRYQAFLDASRFTPDTYYEYLCEQMLYEKTVEYINGFASVSDEEVQAWYTDTLAMQQQNMDEDPDGFASTIRAGYIYTYVPVDTVAVKQILLAFDDELKTEAQTLYDLGDIDGMMALVQDAVDELLPTALEIAQELEDGEDIDTLIEEYNDDPGMTQLPGSKVGYLVNENTTTFISEFSEAALGLMELGTVSEPVVTYNGVHVLQSIKIYEAGIISLEDIFDDIKEALLPGKKQEKFEELSQQWMEEADIKYFYSRLSL